MKNENDTSDCAVLFLREIRVQTWCKFGAKTYRTMRKLRHDMRWKRHKIKRNERFSTIFRGTNASEKTQRDKNIVPLAQIKTHLSRWVFVFISWEQWNESASQILEMTYRSWNSLMRMKCSAVHKDSFYFTICGAYHFKTALPSFQVLQANISFFPAISFNQKGRFNL